MTFSELRSALRISRVKRYRARARLVFWGGAIAVGMVCAAFAVASNHAIAWHAALFRDYPWVSLLVTPLGFVLICYLMRRFFPGAQGSGIPQVIAAINSPDGSPRNALVSLRIALGKFVLTILALASGASVGREGPSVQVGASIMYSIGRFARFPRHYLQRSLILAGGAAGVAAAFNTPIAGVVFAIEQLARSFEDRTAGTLLGAVIVAGVIATALLGNYTYFGATETTLPGGPAWLAVPLCGIIGGLAGGLVCRLMLALQRRIRPIITAHPLRTVATLGFGVALLGLISGGAAHGSGYDEARALLTGNEDEISAWYPLVRATATLLSFLAGLPGGMFAPSLSIGAGLGADLSGLVPSAPVAALVILGMVGYLTGMTQTPLTASVIVLEMAAAHEMILPIMATALLAMGSSRSVCRTSIYEALALQFEVKQAESQQKG